MPIDPFFPPRPHLKKPYQLGEDISELGMGTIYVGIEYRDPDCYWITYHMDNTGVEFTTWVARDFVIDPDPQDMILRIDRVGMDSGRDINLDSFIGQGIIGNWEGRERGMGRGKAE